MKSIKKFLFSEQTSIFSAATIIMFMIVLSRILGLVRQRVLANFFAPNDLALFFAAFRLPDLVFEVLVFGTFSSAFIPVFTRIFKKGHREAWELASTITNIGLVIFSFLAVLVILLAKPLYGVLTPGFGPEHQEQIVLLSRVLFCAQGFFVVSYILTAVLESSRRFIIPAIAPLFYNLGIILGTLLFSRNLGLLGPTLGVVVGAGAHFLIQLPFALHLGFRFKRFIKITDEVKKIGRLALPRVIEVSFLQVAKSVELILASLISTASYTFFTFGNTLQLLPVSLFGTSVAKAALPTLSRQADSPREFRSTLFNALYKVVFLTLPVAMALIVLRIPLVRLIFGTSIFTWESTVQTGMVVSAFAVGVVFQAAIALLARGFYALHDTKTPVTVSITAIILNIIADFILIKGFHLPVWGLAAAFSSASLIQATTLYFLLSRKIGKIAFSNFSPMIKSIIASLASGGVMFFLLKFFDRSVWVKKLSFLGKTSLGNTIPFEKFVLDTRYAGNLLILTLMVILIGSLVYVLLSLILKSRELRYFISLAQKPFRVKRANLPLDTV